jgi:hypothetical protein
VKKANGEGRGERRATFATPSVFSRLRLALRSNPDFSQRLIENGRSFVLKLGKQTT